MLSSKFVRITAPTARAAFGLPALVATCLYVIVVPFGIFRTTSRTLSAKDFICPGYQSSWERAMKRILPDVRRKPAVSVLQLRDRHRTHMRLRWLGSRRHRGTS